jgi:hypothetical protein
LIAILDWLRALLLALGTLALIAAVFVAAGTAMGLPKSWGHSLSLALIAVWLFCGLIGFLRHGGAFHTVRCAHRCCSSGLPFDLHESV